MERTRGKRCKLHRERFHLDKRKIFHCKSNCTWNKLSREVVESSSLDENSTGQGAR